MAGSPAGGVLKIIIRLGRTNSGLQQLLAKMPGQTITLTYKTAMFLAQCFCCVRPPLLTSEDVLLDIKIRIGFDQFADRIVRAIQNFETIQLIAGKHQFAADVQK